MFRFKSIFEMPFSSRQRQLASMRPSKSQAEFIADLTSTDLGRAAGKILWNKLEESKVWDQFTPYADDNLLYVYGLADEDLDEDIILEIINILKVPTPDDALINKIGDIKTPIDIVRLIKAAGS